MVRSNPNLLVRRYKFLDKVSDSYRHRCLLLKDDSVVCVNAWDVSTKAVKAGCVNHFWTEETVLAITIAAHDQNATVNLGNYLNVIKVLHENSHSLIPLGICIGSSYHHRSHFC